VTFYGAVRTLFYPAGHWYFGIRIEGTTNIPASGPAIVAANHVSWLDPAAVGSACPRPVRFLIARHVYDTRATRWFYRGMRTIPVEKGGRDPRGLRAALRALGRGEVVGVFPEGAGFESHAGEREAHAGALLLAAVSGAPFVPVGLTGTRRAWPPRCRFPRPGSVMVRFGEPFTLWGKGTRPRREEMRDGVDFLMERIRSLQSEPTSPGEAVDRAGADPEGHPRT
jgi:1-acyl-sn-glycerol-3-phosphate acyltransferase